MSPVKDEQEMKETKELKYMIRVGVNLEMNPALVEKLSGGQKLWSAAHEDDSKNRINGDAILEAGSYGTSVGILAALFMWIRKKFRNRGKTKEDLAAEKEAGHINRTCGALEAMLLEYIRSAREGMIEEENLDELIGNLEEMRGYDQAGKLVLPGKTELTEIRKSIEKYTEAIAMQNAVRPFRAGNAAGESEFRLLRDQLAQQREMLKA